MKADLVKFVDGAHVILTMTYEQAQAMMTLAHYDIGIPLLMRRCGQSESKITKVEEVLDALYKAFQPVHIGPVQ